MKMQTAEEASPTWMALCTLLQWPFVIACWCCHWRLHPAPALTELLLPPTPLLASAVFKSCRRRQRRMPWTGA